MSSPGVRSMTGFARVRRGIGQFEVELSLKSVNHRGLDLHFHLASELDPYETAMRRVLKRKIGRGHIDVRAFITSADGGAAFTVDKNRLAGYVRAFREAAEASGVAAEPDLNEALRVPGVLRDSGLADFDGSFEAELIELVEQAADTLNGFRVREGAELAAIMRERNKLISAAAEKMEAAKEGVVRAFHDRLQQRLSDLLNGIGVDQQRLMQEAAILADKADIGEEIARLKIHSRQLDEVLSTEPEAGKKLDFLLQEMNRETNTVLSKTSGIGGSGLEITELALATKSEIEKIREQALNLE